MLANYGNEYAGYVRETDSERLVTACDRQTSRLHSITAVALSSPVFRDRICAGVPGHQHMFGTAMTNVG
jgi:hypothetical protein